MSKQKVCKIIIAITNLLQRNIIWCYTAWGHHDWRLPKSRGIYLLWSYRCSTPGQRFRNEFRSQFKSQGHLFESITFENIFGDTYPQAVFWRNLFFKISKWGSYPYPFTFDLFSSYSVRLLFTITFVVVSEYASIWFTIEQINLYSITT